MNSPTPTETAKPDQRAGTFRGAIVRGLGVVMPPLLTVLVLVWAWNAIASYIVRPTESVVRRAVVSWNKAEWILTEIPASATAAEGKRRLLDGFKYRDTNYVPDPTGRRFLPEYVVRYVDENLYRIGPYEAAPATANAYWHRYIELRYRIYFIPLFLIVFLTILYFFGKLFAHGIGRWFVTSTEAGINRIPIVNKVYGSVKQVTDFAFSERELEFNRVVAIEYPRKGIWSLGFVTGSGLNEIAAAAGEPMLAILMPTSPMPMTGFTVQVPRSQAVDLDLTIDEAIQFIVSCGVVAPGTKPVVNAKVTSTTIPANELIEKASQTPSRIKPTKSGRIADKNR